MATTYLQVINRVLEKIGETQVSAAATSLTETYQLLIGSFVQDIKEEIEDAHNWRALRTTFSATLGADDQSVTLTGANERSRLLRIYQQNRGKSVPLAFDVTDATEPVPLIEMDLAELLYKDTIDPDSNNDPIWFALDNSSGDVLDLYVYPRPSGARNLQIDLIVPQARFEPSDLSEVIKIPIRPIVVGATWYALEERGEELGANGLFNEKRFQDAMNAAIARDDAEQGNASELIVV